MWRVPFTLFVSCLTFSALSYVSLLFKYNEEHRIRVPRAKLVLKFPKRAVGLLYMSCKINFMELTRKFSFCSSKHSSYTVATQLYHVTACVLQVCFYVGTSVYVSFDVIGRYKIVITKQLVK
jgi:hypothetical protein